MIKRACLMIGELIFFFLILLVTTNQVDGSFKDGPNLGRYIYEEHQVVTQKQYDEINEINDRLQTGKKIQNLYVAILDDDPTKPDDSDKIYKYLGIKFYDEDAESILKEWPDYNENKDNLIILYHNQGRVGFVPSELSQFYITDYKFWKITLGKMNGIRSGGIDTQIDGLVNISNLLVRPILYSVNVKDAKSSKWWDVKSEFFGELMFFGFAIFILSMLIYFIINSAGADYAPDNYDNGFYDGYSYSNYQNHDDDNNDI
ncbi:hypothetical protein [Companilactobacillus sp. HBUAS59699]|uniref:hypothetical protein n=1 Tax=Companilactobacillus sp. HBUAS59699 TaxID=3109358 RepID=UPI002FEEE75E